MLLLHFARFAASRACWTAGKRSAMSTPMMAMTTSSSMSVKPIDFERRTIRCPFQKTGDKRDEKTIDDDLAANDFSWMLVARSLMSKGGENTRRGRHRDCRVRLPGRG